MIFLCKQKRMSNIIFMHSILSDPASKLYEILEVPSGLLVAIGRLMLK